MASFIFGGNTGRSYKDLRNLRGQGQAFGNPFAYRAPQNPGEGLTALGIALASRIQQGRAEKSAQEGQQRFNSAFSEILGGRSYKNEAGENIPVGQAQFAGQVDPRLARLMGDPNASEGQRALMRLMAERQLAAGDAPSMTDDMREYEFAKQQGYEGGFYDWLSGIRKAGASSVNVNNGTATLPEYNKLPAGYVYKRTDEGQIFTDETGTPVAVPIPGSPAEIEAMDREDKQNRRAKYAKKSGDVILDDIDRAIDLINTGGILNGTGFSGVLMQHLPRSDARKMAGFLKTIQGISGLDKVQELRDASPTGAALGQVSNFELETLQGALGTLDQGSDSETLLYNLKRVRNIYDEIVHGPRPSQAEEVPLEDIIKKYSD